MRWYEGKKSAGMHFLNHSSLHWPDLPTLRIFSSALKKHVELRAPKVRLQAAPLRNLPTWQTDLSIIVLEMEGYSAGDLDGEAMEQDEEEEPEEG
jgi:hypothetical protein